MFDISPPLQLSLDPDRGSAPPGNQLVLLFQLFTYHDTGLSLSLKSYPAYCGLLWSLAAEAGYFIPWNHFFLRN